MRKTKILMPILSCILFLSGCGTQGRVNKARSIIGESEVFTEVEIKGAILAVKENFKGFEDCSLLEVVYDEKKSDNKRENYLRYGKGSRKELKKEQVLVLYSTFEVGSSGKNNSLKVNTIYSNWSWIVIREEGSDKWTVDDWGY